MKPQSSLPHSQAPATCLCPEPLQSSPWSPFHFLKILFNIILPFTSRSSKWFFPSGFPTKTLYTPLLSSIRATCHAHLNLLDFITRTILDEQYRSLSSSLCNFLHFPVTPSLLGPNILLNTLFSNTMIINISVELWWNGNWQWKTEVLL